MYEELIKMVKFLERFKYSEDQDILTLHQFIDSIGKGFYSINDGGVKEIIIDGFLTNIHLNSRFSLHKIKEDEDYMDINDLYILSLHHIIELHWVSK